MTEQTAATLLWVLWLLFAGRVAGQLIVAIAHPRWLPPMDAWFSGVLAYPVLLATQLAVLVAMAAASIAVGRGELADVRGTPIGNLVVVVAIVYAGAMAVRYVVRMWRRPDQRWLGGTIPIVFHLDLAAWLFVLGTYLRG